MIRFGSLSNDTPILYGNWCAGHSSEFSLNVPLAIYGKEMSLNIKDYGKIIAISEDNQWLAKYQ
jgi:hypothetical protein